MPKLNNYTQFDGLHWETGTVRNALAYQGVTAPHTGKPFSEAMLMGISGGAVMGYFTFMYEGHDPHAKVLTRNTFDPWTRMLSRLGVVQSVMHTSKDNKAVQNLVETLEEGVPAIVWADMYTLPYNALGENAQMWAMFPILLYAYEKGGEAHIADRAFVPLTVEADVLHQARARVKKDKFRVITLDPPDMEKLATAVHAGIWDCINLFTEKPPKGSKNNFGLAAYNHWAKLLTKPKTRQSWEKLMPTGRPYLAALMSQYSDINHFGKNSPAERDVYADFLEEAAVLLEKPTLNEAATLFRRSCEAWGDLSQTLLPDDIDLFAQCRRAMDAHHQLFLQEGNGSTEQRRQLAKQWEEFKVEADKNFPLDSDQVAAHRERIANGVMTIHDLEAEAVDVMKDAMG